jgi:hypothetical protein
VGKCSRIHYETPEIPKINLNIIVDGARGVLKLSKDERYIV